MECVTLFATCLLIFFAFCCILSEALCISACMPISEFKLRPFTREILPIYKGDDIRYFFSFLVENYRLFCQFHFIVSNFLYFWFTLTLLINLFFLNLVTYSKCC